MRQRIITAMMYAAGAAIASYQATGAPSTPEGWAGFVVAAVVTFWGKFSSSRTIIAPNFIG